MLPFPRERPRADLRHKRTYSIKQVTDGQALQYVKVRYLDTSGPYIARPHFSKVPWRFSKVAWRSPKVRLRLSDVSSHYQKADFHAESVLLKFRNVVLY